MKINKILSLIFVCLLVQNLAVEVGNDVNSVRILSVSTQVDVDNANRVGSIEGGTRLYIKIVGHDANVSSNNSILVGPYACEIPDMGVNEIFITCITTAMTDSDYQYNLNVVVSVVDKSDSQCYQEASLCQFSYTSGSTPVAEEIIPRASVASNRLNWFGEWIVTNTNQINKMLLGDQICDRYFEGLNPDTDFDGSDYGDLQCDIGGQTIGGFYSATFTSLPGDAEVRTKMTTVRSSTLNTTFDFQVVPEITAVSHSYISTAGAVLSITANGLPSSTSDATVEWNGSSCTVLTTDYTTKLLTCQLPSGQSNPSGTSFVSTAGVRLQRFNTSMWDLASAITDYRKAASARTNVLDSDEIISTTELYESYEDDSITYSRIFYVFSGYFTAPRTGSYQFTSATYYLSQTYLQTTGSSTDSSTMTLINYIKETTSIRRPYSGRFSDNKAVSDAITLTAGQAYYYEIFAISSSSTYFYHSTGVRIPTGDSNSYINSAGQVTQLAISYPFTKEQVSISFSDLSSSTTGYFNIYFIAPYGTKLETSATYWSKPSTAFSKSSTCTALSNHFQNYLQDVRSTCTRTDILDSSNVVIGATWVLTFASHRKQIKPTFNYDSTVSSAPVWTVITSAGDDLSGTYKITINGSYLKISSSSSIPYTTEAWQLQSALSTLLGTNSIEVIRQGAFVDGPTFTFDFYGVQSAVPITFEKGALSGETNVVISVSVTTIRSAGDGSLVYPTIESDLLTQRGSVPSVILKVNDLQSVCSVSAGCGVTVLSDANAPSFTSFSDDTTKKQVTISGFTEAVGSSSVVQSNFTVIYNGEVLQTLSYSSGSIVAQYTNRIAGQYKPIVDQAGFGIALSTSVSNINVLPIITSLSKTTIYSFGGSDLVITGENFPTSTSTALTVTIGGVTATISSVSNTSITVVTPTLTTTSSQNVVVTYGTQVSAAVAITVDNSGAITITGLSSTVASPVEKTLITVTGTNFGTDATALNAFLDEMSGSTVLTLSKYQVNVVSASSTSIKVLLGGGTSGNYRLRVVQVGYGSNDPSTTSNLLEYNIYVTALSRTTSSRYGGSTLTITGTHFATDTSDNQVLVVYSASDSEYCVVTAATSTELQCTLPDMSTHMGTETTVAYSIEIWGKLIAQAITSDSSLSLKISYQDALVPSVTSLSATWALAGSSITVTGTGLSTDITTLGFYAVDYEDYPGTVTASTGTTVTVTLPFLEGATAYSFVLSAADGNSAPQTLTIGDYFSGFTGYTGISSGGQEISLKYSGATSAGDPVFKLGSTNAEVLSFDSTTGAVKLRLPATTAGSNTFYYARRSTVTLNSDGTFPWNTYATAFVTAAPSWTVTAQVTSSGQVITVTGTGLTSLSTAYLQVAGSPKGTQYASTSTSGSATSLAITFANAPAGSYRLYLLNSSSAYPLWSSSTYSLVKIELPTLTASSSIVSSFAGGSTFTISGSNFNTDDITLNVVTVCGNEATVVSATTSLLTLQTPPVYTAASISAYDFSASSTDNLTGYSTFGDDSTSDSSVISDGALYEYYSSSNTACYVGIDLGSASQVILTKFELYPRSASKTDASAFFGTLFQGSNDMSTWTTILKIGTDFHLGKNMYLIDTLIDTGSSSDISNPFRYLRLYDSTGTSQCELVEVNIYGFKTSTVDQTATNLSCPIAVSVNESTLSTLSSTASYTASSTYVVESIVPNYGDINGSTDVTLTLDKTISGTVTVLIDGAQCLNVATSGLTVTCTTAAKTTSVSSSLVVTVNNYQAVNNGVLFYYGYLWSLDSTWGGDFAPIDGDVVSVSDNKTLIVDVAYVGVLNTVVVDTADIVFANDMDIHFEAYNIIVRSGRVIIGTKGAPVTGSVRITMHGTTSDTQFPTVGNKGLSVHNGSIQIQGKERVVTWTELSETAEAGATSITVYIKDAAGFDWAVGEVIVIASTDFSHNHAERRTIETITYGTETVVITFETPLVVRHVSIEETYNGTAVPMRAEVGLLTRNVIFEGDEATSTTNTYGAHIMLHGASASASIRHAEFRRTGQPKITGRYPIHFHMVGDVSGSIVEGNAVHDSFARVLTIHATHYLQVKNNVGYNCAGHNIFLEDGIETNNVIEQNLMIGTKQVWSMLQSDITAASYWITNPLNTVVNNRAAGGDFYGFWYEVKEHPDGPSARNDICPQGMALGQFEGNIAHSYDRFGLRIFVLTNLQYPCNDYRDDSLENPFSANESYQITWSNFISFRNHEDGVLAEEVGNMVFENFYLIDNKQSGFNSYLTNRTDEEVILKNSIIVGKSLGNAATDGELDLTRGLITPRTDGFRAENVHFENFDNTMTVFKSISYGWHFKKWVTGGKLSRFSGITYSNISAKKMYWENWRREIYEDIDGTLTGRGVQAWVTPSGVHLSNSTKCTTSTTENSDWDDAVICTSQVVRVEFSNPEDLDEFLSVAIYAQLADSTGATAGGEDTDNYYVSKAVQIKNHAMDLKYGFVGTFLVGEITSVQWELTAIDFTHMSVQLSPYHTGSTADDTIVLKFPYTDYRETWDIGYMVANNITSLYANVTDGLSDQQSATALASILARDCKHGDWFNDVADTTLYLCLNENGRNSGSTNQRLDRTDVNAVKCRVNCALPPGQCVVDGVTRKLSDSTTWQSVTTDGEVYNVPTNTTLTIPCPWTLIVDTDLTAFDKIIVEGTLKIDPTQDINISAYGIWIDGGTILAEGSTSGSAYTKNLNIKLLGNRDTATQFVVDDLVEVGNKVILNTGNFTLRGNPPSSTATRLVTSLEAGSTSITVADATGWAVGDTIAIAATQFDRTQDEQFTISAVSGNVVTLSSAASYYHYGAASVTLSETWSSYTQELDLRAQVLHLTRNIRITGEEITGALQWGCRVLTYNWVIEVDSSGNELDENEQTRLRGINTWDGVEVSGCGQANTIRGAVDFNLATADSKGIVSTITNSAIHNCPGYCMNIEESDDITITNTNFYNGRPILMRIYTATGLTITYNHFAAARARDYTYDTTGMVYDMTANLYFFSDQDIIADNILIAYNTLQGSEGPCLVVPHTTCDTSSSISSTVGIFGNQAQTCLVGAMFKKVTGDCQWAGKVSVSRSSKGFMVNPTKNGIVVENVLATESTRSVILRFAHEDTNNVGYFKDSTIYGVAIADDATAYDTDDKAALCQNTYGTQNLVVTRGGEDFPLRVQPLNFDVICDSEVFDAQLYQTNVSYHRFKITYTETNLTKCSTNQMMATHPSASDATAGTYNNDVTCTDCETAAYFQFMSPQSIWSGWFGGCGLFLCTAPENVLNVDQDGSLFGTATTAVSHNDGIVTSDCTKHSDWNNAYSCPGTNYAQVEWRSDASDYNTKSSAPVYLTSSDGSYTNKLNMFREWQWDGSEPLNLRENIFLSTTIVNKVYTVEYNGSNPYNILHRIQRRTYDTTGEPGVWIIFVSTYSVPLNIEITNGSDDIVDSYIVADDIDLTTKTSICGANIYDYTTRTIQFAFNGDPDCYVRATVLDTVRIMIKVSITVDEFFNDTTKSSFISKVAAFLGIDYSKVKVVGATTVSGRLLDDTSSSDSGFTLVVDIVGDEAGTTTDAAAEYATLSSYATSLSEALSTNSVSGLAADTYNVTSYSTYVATDTNGSIYGTTTSDSSDSSNSDSTLAIVLGVVIGLVLLSIIIVGYCAYKRYNQKKNLIQLQEAENSVDISNKEAVKVDATPSDQLQEKANSNTVTPFQN